MNTLMIGLLSRRRGWTVLVGLLILAALAPVLLVGSLLGVIAQQTEAGCANPGTVEQPAGATVNEGLFALPLRLQPGRWYEVGATEYGGPSDPTAGDYGSIPNPGQSFLPAHPDSFAELSLLTHNPANSGTFSFSDANALGGLPYLSGLRVAHDGHQALLLKRDIGYGQGPGQLIPNGQPYRLDVWWQAAQVLAITKTPVQIQLTPNTGAAATLQSLPEPSTPNETGTGCPTGNGDVPLALAAGSEAKILPDGLAAAGEEAPIPVKRMVTAGNQLHQASYLYGGGHGTPLAQLQSAYDCSSAVSYVLHAGGVFGNYAQDSTELEHYGLPGPGRFISIYANPAHAFMYVAGLRFDTVEAPAYDSGPNSGKPGPKWRVSPTVPDWAAWTVRHPPGL
jgi:hypothetical protein